MYIVWSFISSNSSSYNYCYKLRWTIVNTTTQLDARDKITTPTRHLWPFCLAHTNYEGNRSGWFLLSTANVVICLTMLSCKLKNYKKTYLGFWNYLKDSFWSSSRLFLLLRIPWKLSTILKRSKTVYVKVFDIWKYVYSESVFNTLNIEIKHKC